jgi:P27 family predicted phage terminase small subunit
MKGRKPTPTAVRLLQHGRRLKRPINPLEPQHAPLAIDTALPDELTDPAAALEWHRVIATLARGHVTIVDRPTLIAYCLKYAQWRAMEAAAQKGGFWADSLRAGAPTPNPLIKMANAAMQLMLKAAAELGLTPTSRSRVQAQAVAEPTGTPVDDFTAWQRKRRSGP